MFGNEPELSRQALERADATSALIPPGLAEEPQSQYERAWLALDGARALAGIGDPEAALARVSGAPAKFRALESYGEAFLAELTLGEVLLTLGRPTAAEPVLRGVVNGLPRDAAALPRAAYALAHALVQQDRADEARELGAQYGFDLD
jgi:tetratricopeptide (TPR) repeat protein